MNAEWRFSDGHKWYRCAAEFPLRFPGAKDRSVRIAYNEKIVPSVSGETCSMNKCGLGLSFRGASKEIPCRFMSALSARVKAIQNVSFSSSVMSSHTMGLSSGDAKPSPSLLRRPQFSHRSTKAGRLSRPVYLAFWNECFWPPSLRLASRSTGPSPAWAVGWVKRQFCIVVSGRTRLGSHIRLSGVVSTEF